MKILNKMVSALGYERKSNTDLSGNRFYDQYIINRDFTRSEKPLRVAASLRAGMLIAQDVARMPAVIKTVKELDNGLVERARVDSPLARMLLRKPNNYMTAVEFFETVTMHAVFEGVGRAYIERDPFRKDRIKALHPITDGAVTAARDYDTGEVFYSGVIDGIVRFDRAPRTDFIEVSNPRYGCIEGLDISHEMEELFGLAVQLQDRQLEDADTKGTAGIISFPDAISPEIADNTIKSLSGKLPGTAILDAGAKFQQLMATAAENQTLETRRFVIEEVARVFGVHPLMMMHDGAGQSLTRVQDVMDFHLSFTLSPWLSRWEQAIAFSLLDDDQIIDFDETQLFKMSPKDRAEYLSRALGAGGNQPWLTRDEARNIDGRNPVGDDGGFNNAAEEAIMAAEAELN
ncbi:MAG: phage portal protein [Pseudomonadota bacterium]